MILAAPLSSFGVQPLAPFDIPRVDGITVDGDLSDWGDRGFQINAMNWEQDVSPIDDYDPRFRLGWNDDGLLVAATVRDDKLFSPESLAPFFWFVSGDCIVLYASAGAEQPKNVRFVAALGPKPEFTDLKTELKLPDGIQQTAETTPKVVMKKMPGGYTFEFLIPWKSLAYSPKTGDEVGMQIFANDCDPTGLPNPVDRRNALHWNPNTSAPNPEGMYKLRLADKPSAPLPATARTQTGQFTVPTVMVTGPAESAGKTVEIRKGDKVLGTTILELRDGRTRANYIIPKSDAKDAYADIDVFVDKTLVARVDTSEQTPVTGQLSVIPRLDTKTQKVNVRVAMGPRAFVAPQYTSKVSVKTPDGKVVYTGDCALDETGTTFSIPAGLYVFAAEIKGLNGWDLQGKEACVVAADPKQKLLATVAEADKMKADPKYADYAGMLDYLGTDIRQYVDQPLTEEIITNTSHQAIELATLMHKIRETPKLLSTLRGQQEWAYLSKVDGTGQPFTIVIPEDYTPDNSYRLEVNLHGASGSHQVIDPGGPGLRLHVLGRSPFGRYVALSEVDVREAIDYVRSHWNVDADRIHLEGDSMGGGGTFKLASRFPDLFASARPRCGYGTEMPVENMVNLPIYSIHGSDDPLVPVIASRAAIRKIQESGGVAIQSETLGYGHMINGWADGVATASLWALSHKRVGKPARVHYTATDELARKAYWVEVVEWGPEGRPASIDATLQDPKTLYLNLDNVAIAAFDIANAPADLKSSLTVVINRRFIEIMKPPVPSKLWILRDKDAWKVSSQVPEERATRLHYPGGAMALFHGEPLMVVWGTQGTSEVTARIRESAESARKSTSPGWVEVKPHRKLEAIFNTISQLVYGKLPGKPDIEVTDADMQKYNLLLIGTADQNSVVARLASKLPVSIENGAAKSDDGQSWAFRDRALGLLYYNPLAPKRLVYWVASDDPRFYKPGAELMNVSWGAAPADLAVISSGGTFVAARRFDSRWNWESGYANSPKVTDEYCSVAGSAELESKLLGTLIGSDYVLVNRDWTSTAPAMAAGETRMADLAANDYCVPIGQMFLTGKELFGALEALEKGQKVREEKIARKEDAGDPLPRFLPAIDREKIDPERVYSVTTNQWPALTFFRVTTLAPESFSLLDHSMREACVRYRP